MTMTTTNTQLPPEQKPEGETTSSKDRTFMFRAEVRGLSAIFPVRGTSVEAATNEAVSYCERAGWEYVGRYLTD